MRLAILLALLATLLSSCVGLPTLETTPTIVPTTLPSTATATFINIEITGNVYVRDDQGKVMGWLYEGDEVQGVCFDDWCRILSGKYRGYHFWRGCSSDNPEQKSCNAK